MPGQAVTGLVEASLLIFRPLRLRRVRASPRLLVILLAVGVARL